MHLGGGFVRKTFLILILILISAFALASCGEGSEEPYVPQVEIGVPPVVVSTEPPTKPEDILMLPYFVRLEDSNYVHSGFSEPQESIIVTSFNSLNSSIHFVGYADGWRFYQQYTRNAGSGEYFWDSEQTGRLFARNQEIYSVDPEAGFREFSDLRAGYSQMHNGRIYFLDLNFEPFRTYYLGYGWLSSMNLDGSDIQRIVEEEVRGEFFIVDDTIFFLQADSLVMYTINTDGTNRQRFVDVGAKLELPWELYFSVHGNFILITCHLWDAIIVEANGDNPMTMLTDYHGFLDVINWTDDAVLFRNVEDGSYWIYRVR